MLTSPPPQFAFEYTIGGGGVQDIQVELESNATHNLVVYTDQNESTLQKRSLIKHAQLQDK